MGECASSRDLFFLLFAAFATRGTRREIPAVRGIVVDSWGQAHPLWCSSTTTAPRWFELTAATTMVNTFSRLNPYDHHTIHAENDGVTSKSRTVSLSGQELQNLEALPDRSTAHSGMRQFCTYIAVRYNEQHDARHSRF